MKKILTLFTSLITAALLSVCSGAENPPHYTYTPLKDNTARLDCYNGTLMGKVVIPSEIDGYTVTEIGDSCFVNQTDMTSVEIPSSVTMINDCAFQNCTSLKEINFSEGLRIVDDYAFSFCTALESISLPDTVTYIGRSSFNYCTALERFETGDGAYKIEENAFNNCYNLKEAILGKDMRDIRSYAFQECGLEKVYIPRGVKEIGYDAFGCESLKQVYYGGSSSDWEGIDIRGGNQPLETAEMTFYANPDGTINQSAKNADILIIVLVVIFGSAVIAVGIIIALRKSFVICNTCGERNDINAKFCGQCGKEL